ncbi:MAG: hypothetical protein WD740_02190 [Anaerolineales bacterium]
MQLTTLDKKQVDNSSVADVGLAALRALAYADVFDYPLRAGEVHRYLIGCQANAAQVHDALGSLPASQAISAGSLWALPGRQALFDLRPRRTDLAQRLWPLALKYGRRIAALPFVRMVAVTGALAADNVKAGADIDYLVITRPGYVWVTRAMILALDRSAFRSPARLCPNFILAESHLALEDRDLYAAQELARMVPIAGLANYKAMRAANDWTEAFLPNAQGAPRQIDDRQKLNGWLKNASEGLLANPATRWLESWEMRRKITKFSAQNSLNTETRFSADFCKGHFDGHKQRTMAAFQARLESLGLAAR